MKIRTLMIVAATIGVFTLAGCSSKAGAEQNTNPPVTTPPPTTSLAPTGDNTPPILSGYANCLDCHGYVPAGILPGSHGSLTVDGD
ncbi:MAG: hypothetical protein TUN42_04155 [Dehalogenimonas sp.]